MAIKRVVALVGGVGGAKLALGLQALSDVLDVTIITNTGDDFWHYGLRVCPDTDTVLYTLAGLVDSANGWGVAEDTTVTLETLRRLGDEAWFRLGDKDLAVHLVRTGQLRDGATLTQVTAHLAKQMGIPVRVLPMSDSFVETKVQTATHGELDFQTYFVRYRWQPVMTGLRYAGAEQAQISLAVQEALAEADAILIAPSNPWLSIAPMLAVGGMRETLLGCSVPRVAVTPIVAGNAIKGPTAKLMTELGIVVSPQSVAQFYGGIINGFVQDIQDKPFNVNGLRLQAFDTIMKTHSDKVRLVGDILSWLNGWGEVA